MENNLDLLTKKLYAEGVEKAVTQLLEQTAAYPNFVLSTGCDVPPGVPEANIQVYYAALAAYNGRM